jgi:hypothetical protein
MAENPQERAQKEGEGYVRIGNREIYDMLVQVRDRVGKLEDRVDSVLKENVTLGKRVRGLELRFYGVVAGLVGALVILLKMGGVPV